MNPRWMPPHNLKAVKVGHGSTDPLGARDPGPGSGWDSWEGQLPWPSSSSESRGAPAGVP